MQRSAGDGYTILQEKGSEKVDCDPIGSHYRSPRLLIGLLVASTEAFKPYGRRTHYSSNLPAILCEPASRSTLCHTRPRLLSSHFAACPAWSGLMQIRGTPPRNPFHILLCLIKIQVLHYSTFITRHETRSEVPMSCPGFSRVGESLRAGISIPGDDGRELVSIWRTSQLR